MSVRNTLVLLLALSTLSFLVACGGNNGTAAAVAPPSGAFGASNLNGTYVFSVSGSDLEGGAYAMVGAFTANGTGGISAGNVDISDLDTTEFPNGPVFDASISATSSYHVSVDGRGQATLNTNVTGLSVVLDFVLSTGAQGLVTEFDDVATGSGTLDLQTANTTPIGSYAFSLSGASGSSPSAAVGNFTLSGSSVAGFGDFNEGGLLNYPDSTLSGSLILGPSQTPNTVLTLTDGGTAVLNGTFDVFAIDATHLKFIEMDGNATLSGDAYSQTSTAFPTGNLAYTLAGVSNSGDPLAAGGYMTVTSGSASITGSEDYNLGGTITSSAIAFSATYAVDPNDSGRYILTIPSGTFVEGTTYAAYPSSGGTLLLEVDSSGITSGAALTQTTTAFATTAQGYGANLSGLDFVTGSEYEVDDIAEFATNPTGTAVTGLIDENSGTYGQLFYDQILSGNYGTIDSNGRYGISATTGNSSVGGTLEGGFNLTLYTVDGTTFPFVELDSGQTATGVILTQNASATPAVAHSHMFVTHPLFQPRARHTKKQ